MLRPLLIPRARFIIRPSQVLSLSLYSNLRHQTPTLNMQTPPATRKPPNVLIFQPSKDSTCREFLRAREALEHCLTPERYAIYALGYDEIAQKAPWKENCRLVVIPPAPGAQESSLDAVTQLSSMVLTEIMSYLKDGGAVLSMNRSANRYLGLHSLVTSPAVDCSITLKERNVRSPNSGVGGVSESIIFHATNVKSHGTRVNRSHVITEQSMSEDILSRDTIAHFLTSVDENSNQSNNIPASNCGEEYLPAVEVVSVMGEGCAIVCEVDLLPLPLGETDISLLVKLKKDVLLRSMVLGHLLGLLGMECSEERLPELTHTYLVSGEKERIKFLSACAPLMKHTVLYGREMSLQLIQHNYQSSSSVDPAPSSTHSKMALIAFPADWQLDSQPFDFKEYFYHLHTAQLGRTLLYTSVISSTQSLFTGNIDFCNALTTDMGIVSVAGQQTSGKGRGGNVWLSPKGSMMFSTVLKFPSTSRLAQRLTLLQHLVAMAVVDAIRSFPNCQDLPLRIKWPNDIYYQDQVKLGGILVTGFAIPNTSSQTAVVGCGVNIDNKHPTMSVNDCIAIHNTLSGTSLPPVTVEACLAKTLFSLENLIAQYEKSGFEGLEELYYKYWLHSGSTVKLANYGESEAVVTGIDEYGYLLVRRREDNQLFSLQPDGNSFDIMRGLIAMKSIS